MKNKAYYKLQRLVELEKLLQKERWRDDMWKANEILPGIADFCSNMESYFLYAIHDAAIEYVQAVYAEEPEEDSK